MRTSRDSCYQIYGEIDYITKATNTSGICGNHINRVALLKPQQNVNQLLLFAIVLNTTVKTVQGLD